jgi:D-xylose transport system substrate-binding protein
VKTYLRRGLVVAAVATLALGAMGACGKAKQAGGGSSNAGSISKGFKIGLLLPENKTARYEKFDKPYIEQNITKLCPKCTVLYSNANQDASTQQQQFESMLTNGVKVIILDSVDYKAISGEVSKAKAQNIPVVAYDRLANGPISAYTSFDNEKIGEQQGQALLDALKRGGDPKRGDVVMINGATTDPNAGFFKKGAHKILDGQVNIAKEYDTPDWDPTNANTEMAGAISAIGIKKIIGVYSANDGMAGGAISALTAAKASPMPPVTGQDAEVAGIQRLLNGSQLSSIYKSIKPEAAAAAQFAVDLGAGKKASGTSTVDNGTNHSVPTVLAPTVVLTKDNIASTVIKDGYWTYNDICTAQYVALCKSAGINP